MNSTRNEILNVFRTECKYSLSIVDANRIKNKLIQLLPLDTHSIRGEYMVRSLYFDSINNYDYFTKESGTEIRKKIRLRIYNAFDKKAKLEVKYKYNNQQQKKSLIISKMDAEELIKLNYQVLLKYASSNLFALEVLNMMRSGVYKPVSLIEYQRLAFTYSENDTRITFDSRIRYSETDFRLFEKYPIYQVLPDDFVTLEIKFNNYLLGFISEVLKAGNLNQLAVSKYCLGRQSLEKYFID